jgi:hypothetical protein
MSDDSGSYIEEEEEESDMESDSGSYYDRRESAQVDPDSKKDKPLKPHHDMKVKSSLRSDSKKKKEKEENLDEESEELVPNYAINADGSKLLA